MIELKYGKNSAANAKATMPATTITIADSVMNWQNRVLRSAPMAFRNPISLARDVDLDVARFT